MDLPQASASGKCRRMRSIISISSHVLARRVGQGISTFAFERLGIGVMALPTVLSVIPTAGALRGAPVPQEIFDLLLAGLESAGALSGLDALHIGYLRTAAQVASVGRVIALVRAKSPGAAVFLDPILGDAPGGLYVPPETAAAIAAELVPHADILTPNLFELGYLAGGVISGEGVAVAAARSLGAKYVAVTSAPSAVDRSSTLLVERTSAHRLVTTRFETAPHGTGDLLAALFLARMLMGEKPLDALSLAVSSVHGLIALANSVGLPSLPHIEHQELLIAPHPCVQVDRIDG